MRGDAGYFSRVSIEQAACLMGFPAAYIFIGPINARFCQLGNAIPPPLGLGRALAEHLLELL
jgi:DNA (cytosine-5)-methyltransferase 1